MSALAEKVNAGPLSGVPMRSARPLTIAETATPVTFAIFVTVVVCLELGLAGYYAAGAFLNGAVTAAA